MVAKAACMQVAALQPCFLLLQVGLVTPCLPSGALLLGTLGSVSVVLLFLVIFAWLFPALR